MERSSTSDSTREPRPFITVIVAGFFGGVLLVAGCGVSDDRSDRPDPRKNASPEASPTSAPARLVLSDRRGDVWRQDIAADGRTFRVRGRPSEDVRRVTAVHTADTVEVTFVFQDLQAQPRRQQTPSVTILTPGRRYDALVMIGPRSQGIRHGLLDFGPPALGNAVRCAGLAHRADFHRDQVGVSVPRTCLGDPAWVRLRFFNYTAGLGNEPWLLDNPHNAGAEPRQAATARLRHPE